MPQYETYNEAQTRLSQTVFLYKDMPVYCNEAGHDEEGKVTLHLTFYPGGSEKAIVKLADPDLRYRGLQLGYINMPNGASYLTRCPVRKYKQGFTGENIRATGPVDGKYNRPKWGDIFKSPAFQETLLGKYPTITQAAERLMAENPDGQKPPSVAFDRRFALIRDDFRKDFLLEYRGRVIGYGDLHSFRCAEDFVYLQEVLENSGIRLQ